MPSKHRLSSSLRRLQRADLILRTGITAMRPCQFCLSRSLLCVIAKHSEHCEQCVRHHRLCELAPPSSSELERLSKQERKLFREASEAKAKAIRLSQQRRLLIKRMKEIGQREDQNILELEIDEMMEDTSFPDPLGPSGVSTPRATAPSPRPFSSIDDALQDSQRRTPASPVGSG